MVKLPAHFSYITVKGPESLRLLYRTVLEPAAQITIAEVQEPQMVVIQRKEVRMFREADGNGFRKSTIGTYGAAGVARCGARVGVGDWECRECVRDWFKAGKCVASDYQILTHLNGLAVSMDDIPQLATSELSAEGLDKAAEATAFWQTSEGETESGRNVVGMLKEFPDVNHLSLCNPTFHAVNLPCLNKSLNLGEGGPAVPGLRGFIPPSKSLQALMTQYQPRLVRRGRSPPPADPKTEAIIRLAVFFSFSKLPDPVALFLAATFKVRSEVAYKAGGQGTFSLIAIFSSVNATGWVDHSRSGRALIPSGSDLSIMTQRNQNRPMDRSESEEGESWYPRRRPYVELPARRPGASYSSAQTGPSSAAESPPHRLLICDMVDDATLARIRTENDAATLLPDPSPPPPRGTRRSKRRKTAPNDDDFHPKSSIPAVCAEQVMTDPSARPRRNPDRGKSKGDPVITELRRLIGGLHGKTPASDYTPIIERLQQILDDKRPGMFRIHPRVISFLNRKDQRLVTKCLAVTNEDFLNNFLISQVGVRVSVAVMATWTETPVAKTHAAWAAFEWHVWLLFQINAHEGTKGKTLALWDCNAGEVARDRKSEHDSLRGRERTVVEFIRGCGTGRKGQKTNKNTQRFSEDVWLNRPHIESNDKGECVRMSFEHLVDLVAHGMPITFTTNAEGNLKVADIPGFVKLERS
ncbi:hypothetical protein C8R43DRAFT_952773 [Mycena crocata]|nr:hypothetical protein C8R43DRAFT_965285 [Mycena crocata]KAJ7148165.1 hypothetical protein C8R43DRAFT_952773 [Mycena crocata]